MQFLNPSLFFIGLCSFLELGNVVLAITMGAHGQGDRACAHRWAPCTLQAGKRTNQADSGSRMDVDLAHEECSRSMVTCTVLSTVDGTFLFLY